jgi:hypothetical protein
MRYTLLLHYPEMSPEDLGEGGWEEGEREFTAYAATLQAAGVLIGAEVLQPSQVTTTVRPVDGTLQVQDGPFADTKDQLGGTVVIDVPDLDAAIEWAKRSPTSSWGPIEIRPGATHTVDGVWTPSA